jgi:hypothetical protein
MGRAAKRAFREKESPVDDIETGMLPLKNYRFSSVPRSNFAIITASANEVSEFESIQEDDEKIIVTTW